jgi:hypothetical protein
LYQDSRITEIIDEEKIAHDLVKERQRVNQVWEAVSGIYISSETTNKGHVGLNRKNPIYEELRMHKGDTRKTSLCFSPDREARELEAPGSPLKLEKDISHSHLIVKTVEQSKSQIRNTLARSKDRAHRKFDALHRT